MCDILVSFDITCILIGVPFPAVVWLLCTPNIFSLPYKDKYFSMS